MTHTDERHPSSGTGQASLPALPARLAAVFFSPGRLMRQLTGTPAWLGALFVSAAVVGLSMLLIPAELFIEAQREAALERGVELPEMTERAMLAMRIVIPTTMVVVTLAMSFFFAGLYTVIFAFVLGDEGRYVQYLAAVTHAWFIAALFGLLVTPLRISTGDPQLTLNLGSFFFFLPDGYFLNVLRVLDLTQIWSTLVIAQGAHAIDRRRSFGSAAAILLVILVGVALVVGRFT
jgi:hypothetical protein